MWQDAVNSFFYVDLGTGQPAWGRFGAGLQNFTRQFEHHKL